MEEPKRAGGKARQDKAERARARQGTARQGEAEQTVRHGSTVGLRLVLSQLLLVRGRHRRKRPTDTATVKFPAHLCSQSAASLRMPGNHAVMEVAARTYGALRECCLASVRRSRPGLRRA